MAGDFGNFGQGLGNLFGSMVGGMAQGLATAGGADAQNPLAQLFSQANAQGLNQPLSKVDVPAKSETQERRKDFKPEEILDAAKLNRSAVAKFDCYSEECLILDEGKMSVAKISFRGDGNVSDNFIRIWRTSALLDFSNTEVVDLSGCVNLTDKGIEWLAELLDASSSLYKISIDGCVKVSQHGVSILQSLRLDPEVSYHGTAASILSQGMDKHEQITKSHGRATIKDNNRIHVSKVLVHQPPQPKYKLTSFLMDKQMEPAEDLTFTPEWNLAGTHFTISESVINNPLNSALQNTMGSHVVIPVDLDGDKDKEIDHIMNTIEYNTSKGMPTSELGSNLDKLIYPLKVLNGLWEEHTGRITFVNHIVALQKGIEQMGALVGERNLINEEDSYDLTAILLSWVPTKTRPHLEFLVEETSSKQKVPVSFAFGNADLESSRVVSMSVEASKGDVLRIGLEDPGSMDHMHVLDNCEEVSLWINGEKVDTGTVSGNDTGLHVNAVSDVISLRLLDHYPLSKHVARGKCMPTIEIAADVGIFDEPSGTIISEEHSVLGIFFQPISRDFHVLEYQILSESSDDVEDFSCGLVNEVDLDEVSGNIKDPTKFAFFPLIAKITGQDFTTHSEPTCKQWDRVKIIVHVGSDLMIMHQKKYKIEVFKNDNLIVSGSCERNLNTNDLEEDLGLHAPYFYIEIPGHTKIQLLNMGPSPGYIQKSHVSSVLPNTCFLRPLGECRELQSSENVIWLRDGDPFIGEASLSVIHPSVTFSIISFTKDANLSFGLSPSNFGGDYEQIVTEFKEGDSFECILDTSGLKCDWYGVPVLDQDIKVIFKQNNEVVNECLDYYKGGGLSPYIRGCNMELRLHEMNTDEAQRILSQSISTKKRYIVAGMTTSKKKKDCKKILQEVKTDLISRLENHLEESKAIIDDAQTHVEKSFSGGVVAAQLEVYRRNLQLLVTNLPSSWAFIPINLTTNEGHGKLCSTLHLNQNQSLAFGDGSGSSQLVSDILKKLQEKESKEKLPKILSRSNYRDFLDVNEGQLAAALKLISYWGLVLFVPDMDPWVAILDVPWFVNMLKKLEKVPDSRAGLNVRGLAPDTPVWSDKELGKLCAENSMEQTKLLLDVFLKTHQIVRLAGVRNGVKDVKSYIVNPAHLKDPEVPLTHFYDPDTPEDNMVNLKVVFKFPLAVLLSTKLAVLCRCVQICKPIILTPTYLVLQQDAFQVLILWKKVIDSEQEELLVNVKVYKMEGASDERLSRYASWVIGLFEDLSASTLLSLDTPFTICRELHSQVKFSICAYHDWKGTEDSGRVSVCTLCGNCSQKGMACEHNRISKTINILQCKCEPFIYCCQSCGICPQCATKIWDARTALRPYLDIDKCIESQRAFWGSLANTESILCPYTVNQVTAVKVASNASVTAINLGLISKDDEKFVHLFPGRGLLGAKSQGYHQKSRNIITENCIEENSMLAYNVGDTVTIQLTEAAVKSLDEDLSWRHTPVAANFFYSTNCAVSRLTNTVTNTRGDLGMLVSQVGISRDCYYFDAEILSLPGGTVSGVGIAPGKEISECIGHGTGRETTMGCEKWEKWKFEVGDIIGCGVRSLDRLQVFFTHNDEVVCEHETNAEDRSLAAAILVQKGETIRILENSMWKSQQVSNPEKSTKMPPNQERFDASDGSISLCPKETMLFEEPKPGKRRVFSTVYVENRSQDYIIWKVKANQVERFTTDPVKGIIEPGALVTYRAELKTQEGESIEDVKSQFIWAPLPKFHITDPSEIHNAEKADQLWRSLRPALEEKQQILTMLCQWRSKDGQFEQVIEKNFAEELLTTRYSPMQPSYQVNVMKNGGLVASYWLPKGEYRFAIETNTDQVDRQTAQQDVMVYIPRLPKLSQSEDDELPLSCSDWPNPTGQIIRSRNAIDDELPSLHPNIGYVSILPADLSLSKFLYPTLSWLHDVNSLKAYAVCTDHSDIDGENIGMHFYDRQGVALTDARAQCLPYGKDAVIRLFYEAMAVSKVTMPHYKTMLPMKEELSRLQVETLMQRILSIYAMTAALYDQYSYTEISMEIIKPPELDLDPVEDSELPETCRILEDDSNKVIDEPYNELDYSHYENVMVKDLEQTMSEKPSLVVLTLDVSESDPNSKVYLNLPQVRSLSLNKTETFGSQSEVYVENCGDLDVLLIHEADIPHHLERCRKLTNLHITGSMKTLPKKIGLLQNLTYLRVRANIEKLPASFSLLKSLIGLTISGDPLEDDKKKVLERKFMKNSSSLDTQEAYEEMCKAAIPNWDEDTQYSTDKEKNYLTAASYHYTTRLGHDYTEGDIHGAFPRQILQLVNLESLDLSYQAIRFIPRQISRLIHLRELRLRGCLELKHLPATLGSLPLVSLDLHYCVSLRTPSRDIVERGAEAVLAYLKQMERGKSRNWRTKLMLVGIGGAGKTTLLRALMDDSHIGVPTTEQEITLGISIETWKARNEKRHPGKEVTFSVWDFAGQTVFYNTHQFFLSDRAVYMLVWSGRQGYENSSLDFWLSSIQAHAPDTPIFVVATHADQLKTEIPKTQLKEVYPQIVGFYLVGSTTGLGIPELKEALLQTALGLDYMGEEVPTVFLDLEEQLIRMRGGNTSYLDLDTVTKHAISVGIYDQKDVAHAVKFLHEVGSVQYFDYEILREYIVIDPQWIVNAMASIVTFKNTAIKNGRLKHSDLGKVWFSKQYPEAIHDWLLRLTEMFDLTFQVDEGVSLVPCLLPHDKSVEVKWPPKKDNNLVSLMIVYLFRYLPTGLFNRLQARLFEFSNSKSVWKNGSTLEKNEHYALLSQDRERKLMVEVIGPCPEGILFLIHETLEELINGSYKGVNFEYLIPCPECVTEIGLGYSAMFEASLIREASKLNVPYIQCRKLFHTVPMTVCKALMPPIDNLELDLQLQRSMHVLTEMKESIKTDVFVIYCQKDVHTEDEERMTACPRKVVQALRDRKFTCYFKEDMKPSDTHVLMVSMQEASTLMVFMSNSLAADEHCMELLLYALQRFKDRLVLINLSPDTKWKKETVGINLGQEVYTNMRKSEGEEYKKGLVALEEVLSVRLGRKQASQSDPVCFISYAWNNSAEARRNRKREEGAITACDPRDIKVKLEKKGIKCWLDIEQTGKRGLFEDITEGLKTVDVIVAFVSNEYSRSSNCMMEFRFAVINLSLPIILVEVGTGTDWEKKEIGALAAKAKAPVINMQKDVSEEKLGELEAFIKSKLLTPEKRVKKLAEMKKRDAKISIEKLINVSFQEEYELAQRKVMRLVMRLASQGSTVKYPNLFTLDFMDDTTEGKKQEPRRQLVRKRSTLHSEMLSSVKNREDNAQSKGEDMKFNFNKNICIRYLCEHDQGWHITDKPVQLPEMSMGEKESLFSMVAPYLARILPLLASQAGQETSLNCLKGDFSSFKQHIIRTAIDMALEIDQPFDAAYQTFLQYAIRHDEDLSRGNLKRCLLSGGRVRWLCEEHSKAHNVTVLATDSSEGSLTQIDRKENEYNKIIFESLTKFEHLRKVPKHKGRYPNGQNAADVTVNLQPAKTATEEVFTTAKTETEIKRAADSATKERKRKLTPVRERSTSITSENSRPPSAARRSRPSSGHRPVPTPRTSSLQSLRSMTSPDPPETPTPSESSKGPTPIPKPRQAGDQDQLLTQMAAQMQSQMQSQIQSQLLTSMMGEAGGEGGGTGPDGQNTSQACIIL